MSENRCDVEETFYIELRKWRRESKSIYNYSRYGHKSRSDSVRREELFEEHTSNKEKERRTIVAAVTTTIMRVKMTPVSV